MLSSLRPHLAGHRDSRPVRIGNGAVKQLDAYGQILEAAYLYDRGGGTLTESNWAFLAGLVEIVCRYWQKPDQGIWEMRDEPRHFTHSKANWWLALHRGVQISELRGWSCDRTRRITERDRVRDYLLEQAAPSGWFHQAVGTRSPVTFRRRLVTWRS